ncbi:MAG TPA: phosphate ABC transporter substrate-binding protein [Chloroflexi bacterium]|jgi:phosphate transport system substrate-binding protein|nr:phosphate ABC transporter substrate-binding protein [Chloroflexota bacterium]
MSRYRFILIILLAGLLLTGCRGNPGGENDAPASANTINNKGSDTLVNLGLAWAEQYQALYPEARISVTGGGTGVGIQSLLNGTVQLASASRQITERELQTARAGGIEPVEFVVAQDAIAVIVHPDNPVEQLSLQQISDIYSGKINNWSEVGGEDRPIVRLSRESNSGTHVYFLEAVLRMGREDDRTLFAPQTLLLPSSEGIIAEVSDNPNAIGYDGLGYVTPNVKVLAVSADEDGPYVLPSEETVNNGTYPIARDLYMYTAGEPQGMLLDYLNWILSPDAQQIVSALGFVPVPVES